MASKASHEPGLGNIDDFSRETSTSSAPVKIERVFPIRISIPSKQIAQASDQGHTQATQSAPQESDNHTPRIPSSPKDTPTGIDSSIPPSPSNASPFVWTTNLAETSVSGKRYVTNRCTYTSTDTESHPAASPVSRQIYRCEDEPIHIPGAVQRFGALVAIRQNEDGYFLVRIVSENSQSVIGFDPEALFELQCFTEALAQKDREEFRIRIRSLRVDGSTTCQDVFPISLVSLLGPPIPLFCAMHQSEGSDLVICEFEPEHDIFSPTHPLDNGLPDKPVQVIEHQATEADRQSSTTSRSSPLTSVALTRQLSRPLGPMEIFNISSEIQRQLSAVSSLPELLDIIVGLVSELTGFHRTMIYRFDEDSSGSVVSELVDLRASTDIYKGLHFPAADIPKQARELYLINMIRLLHDREQETARLVCSTFEDAQTPLDLKHSYLRAMSPIHVKYLENMGVRASMSISLVVGGKLWGLISCHNYERSMRIPLPLRELCRGLGNVASSNIEKLIYASRIQARKPLSQRSPKTSPSSYIAASSSDLLDMFGADFGFLVIKGEARTIGKLVAYNESIILLHYVRKRAFTSVYSSHEIAKDIHDSVYNSGFSTISGMLVIPLTLNGSDFLVFFRRGRLKEIYWAGNPNEKTIRPGTAYLEPRSSFKRWSETVVGTSREWTEDQVESAVILSTLYGRFIEVWRQKEAIVQKNRITRLLIRNAGHEFRTPLNSIINYLEVALEETLDERARTHLQRSLEASKSLVFVVNDLLNLTEAEDVEFNVHEDNVDLNALLCEVISAFATEAAKRGLRILLEADPYTSWTVRCDPSAIRQVTSNLLANAIKNSQDGIVQICMNKIAVTATNTTIDVSIQDYGSGLMEPQLNSIFQDFERILDDDEIQASDPQSPEAVTVSKIRPLEIGLGLALTARFVRLNNGQISISSEGEGKGTKVSISVPFRTPLQGNSGKRKTPHAIPLPTPPTDLNFAIPPTASEKFSTVTPFTQLGRSEESLKKLNPVKSSSINPTQTFDDPSRASSPTSTIERFPFPVSAPQQDDTLSILVAEDNPLNSRLLETRLGKRGHKVKVAVNGQDCVDAFIEDSDAFDVILMDMQMPLINGAVATHLIRKFEDERSHSVPQGANPHRRVPIIAVSASLAERRREDYVNDGFDGWVLKPIDFKRLESLLAATKDEKFREELLYVEGHWDKGGWLRRE